MMKTKKTTRKSAKPVRVQHDRRRRRPATRAASVHQHLHERIDRLEALRDGDAHRMTILEESAAQPLQPEPGTCVVRDSAKAKTTKSPELEWGEPLDGCGWAYEGKSHHGLQPAAWGLGKFLYSQPGKGAYETKINDELLKTNNPAVNAIRGAANKFNLFCKGNGIPLKIVGKDEAPKTAPRGDGEFSYRRSDHVSARMYYRLSPAT
jgi:hypothetical protein